VRRNCLLEGRFIWESAKLFIEKVRLLRLNLTIFYFACVFLRNSPLKFIMAPKILLWDGGPLFMGSGSLSIPSSFPANFKRISGIELFSRFQKIELQRMGSIQTLRHRNEMGRPPHDHI